MQQAIHIDCTGYQISADWYEGVDTQNVVVILPGFTSSRANQIQFADFIVNTTGRSALVIDYTGHGDSPFELQNTSPAQHLSEVVRAYDYIRHKIPHAAIAIIGNSYGSFLAAHLTHYRPISQLILRAPAIYAPESLYDTWSLRFSNEDSYRTYIMQYRNNREQLAKHPIFRHRELNGDLPTLIVAHEHDELIPATTSEIYADKFSAQTIVAHGFKHAVSQSSITDEQLELYFKQITNWLKATQP